MGTFPNPLILFAALPPPLWDLMTCILLCQRRSMLSIYAHRHASAGARRR